MKTRIIALIAAVLSSLNVTAQNWVGNLFELDTIIRFKGTHKPKNLNLVKCRMENRTFYFVEQQGFQYGENNYNAVIHALSTDDYEETEIVLPLPENGRNKERYARSLWIYDFSFDGDYLLLTTQDELILYKQIQNQTYRVESTYSHRNMFMGYLHRNKLNFFVEDHDKGFQWFQQRLGSDSATLIRELPYEAPHIVQIQPNRYIFHNQQSVFFLSTRYPRMEVYDLDGNPTDTIRFDLPHWKAFEDEYIQKALSVPYGIERIYAVKDDLYDYSYPKIAMPLRGDILLLYMQFDTLTGKSELQYALRKKNGETSRYQRNNHEDSLYSAARFPFTLFQGGLDKGNAVDDDLVGQLTYSTDVPWRGKKHSDYFEEINRYFSEGSPALAYKIMRFRPPAGEEGPILFTTSGTPLSIESLPSEKTILLLHNGIECSGCVKALLGLMNRSRTDGVDIGHVYPQPVNGLQAFEISNRLRQELDKPFTLYYDTSALYSGLIPGRSLQESDFPCLLFIQKGKPAVFFRSSDLFTPNQAVTEFQKEFLDAWHSFIEK